MARLHLLLIALAALATAALGCTGERGAPRHDAPPASAAASASAAAPASRAAVAFVDKAPGDAARGKELVTKFECNRCHEGTGLAAPPTAKACVGCHQQILAGTFKAPRAALDRWKPNVAPVQFAPSLTSAGKRFRRDFIESYLLDPHDLRPDLVPTMPRLALTRDQARDIATYLVQREGRAEGFRAEPANLKAADASHGRALMEEKGCGSCHVFSGVAALPVTPSKQAGLMSKGIALAPDLRFVRDRYEAPRLVAWLLDPPSVKPDTAMPDFKLSQAEARDIAAYLMTTPLAAVKKTTPKRLPVLERPVLFKEVQERVLGRICQHCHGNPDVALGDGGPGNTGGFGFGQRGLSLVSYRAVSAGLLDNHGERHSVFDKTADGTPLLVAALLARQAEEAGQADPAVRGMPLGLPSLSPEDIQLVETWVAQGRPR